MKLFRFLDYCRYHESDRCTTHPYSCVAACLDQDEDGCDFQLVPVEPDYEAASKMLQSAEIDPHGTWLGWATMIVDAALGGVDSAMVGGGR